MRPTNQDPTQVRLPALCPDFLIETYLDHQVRFPMYNVNERTHLHRS